MTWLPRAAEGDEEFARVLGLCPELHRRYTEFLALFTQQRPIDPHLLQRCGARVTALLRFTAQPLEGNAADVEHACLRFTDKFVLDPHGVTDDDAAAVSAHLGDAGLIAFVEALALFDGFARFRAILGITDPDPEPPSNGERQG